MFDLQEIIERRLAILKGELEPDLSKYLITDDISKKAIKKSLTQAGILDKSGNLRMLIDI